MGYTLVEHRHRFAVWAAARAAQRGFTTVKNLRAALEATTMQKALLAPETFQLSAPEFDAVHAGWCSSTCSSLVNSGVLNVKYGRAAKLVAMYLKAVVIMGDGWDSPLGHNLHPPIDRVLLKGLASSDKIVSPHKRAWRAINWTQLDRPAYDQLIRQLRDAIPEGAPFWTIEEYWEPSDSKDETT